MIKSHLHVVPQKQWKNKQAYLGYLRHLKVYVFAKQFVQTKTVLELGCGSGYGIEYLCEPVSFMVGVDMGADALLEAKSMRLCDHTALSQCLGAGLPFKDQTFDIVLSFQVIEHIVDVGSYLQEIRRVLKPGGMLCVSTPNKALRLLPFQKPWNPYHVKEFTAGVLLQTLQQYFHSVAVYGLYGSSEIQQLEEMRVKQSPVSVYGKMIIPDRLHGLVKNIFHHNTRQNASVSSSRAELFDPAPSHLWEQQYSIEDFYIETNTNSCIDLIGICYR